MDAINEIILRATLLSLQSQNTLLLNLVACNLDPETANNFRKGSNELLEKSKSRYIEYLNKPGTESAAANTVSAY